jgi:hypothetical protein
MPSREFRDTVCRAATSSAAPSPAVTGRLPYTRVG